MKQCKKLLYFQYKIYRKNIFTWSVVLFALMSMYMGFFGTAKEMIQLKFDMLPKEYLQLMGIEEMSQMNNYVTYFGMIFNLLIIPSSIFAITFGINIIRSEEKNKTIEYLYSLPVTRYEIYFSKVLLAVIGIMCVVFAMSLSGILFGYLAGDSTFHITEMLSIIKITGTIPFFFLSLGMLFISAFPKYVRAGLGSGLVMVSYMLGYLGRILDSKLQHLKYLSPFELLSPTNAVALKTETLTALGVIMAITLLAFIAGAVIYAGRDYNI